MNYTETFEYGNFDKLGRNVPYRIHFPVKRDENGKCPAVLFMHGAGERGTDNALQLRIGLDVALADPESPLHDALIIAPQVARDERWVESDWDLGNYRMDELEETVWVKSAVALLREKIEEYNVDTERVYIMGISMGGFGTWDALVRHEPIFAAGVPLCGGGDPSKVDILKEIPIWCVHGTVDSAVPFAGTEEMYNTIVAAGGERITFEPMDGMDHNIWDYATTNGALIDWLFAQNLELHYPPAPETEPVTEAVTEPTVAPVIDQTGDSSATPIAAAVVIAVLAVGAVVGFVMTRKKK